MFKDGEREGEIYRNWAKCSLILVYKHTLLQRTKHTHMYTHTQSGTENCLFQFCLPENRYVSKIILVGLRWVENNIGNSLRFIIS